MPFRKHSSSFEGNTAPLNSEKHKLTTCGTMNKVFLIVLKVTFSLLKIFNNLEAFVRAFTSEAASKAT
jgi:hypothetical protein